MLGKSLECPCVVQAVSQMDLDLCKAGLQAIKSLKLQLYILEIKIDVENLELPR